MIVVSYEKKYIKIKDETTHPLFLYNFYYIILARYIIQKVS